MALDEFLVLNLPFDESDGATKTYDYSSNRADSTVDNAHFEAGKSGNCIRFDGDGKCTIDPSVLPLTGNFTVCTFVKVKEVVSKIIVLLNYSGVNKFFSSAIDVTPNQWYYLAVVRTGNNITIYLNGSELSTTAVASDYGNPVGFAIAEDIYGTPFGNGYLDETRMYRKALTQEEVLSLLDNTKQLAYYVDGIAIKNNYGVSVSKVKGIADALKMKEPLKVDWSGYHGEMVDLSRPRMEAREITLECFIVSSGGKMAFMQAVKSFMELFVTPHKDNSVKGTNGEIMPAGLHRLTIDIHPTKPLVYEVYLPDGADVDKEWDDKKMVGTFSLKLREPEPVKRVLKHLRINDSTKRISVTLTTVKLINIYWGDGTTTQDVYGTNVTITHDYQENGEYFASITGVIEDITAFDTNAIVVWSKL